MGRRAWPLTSTTLPTWVGRRTLTPGHNPLIQKPLLLNPSEEQSSRTETPGQNPSKVGVRDADGWRGTSDDISQRRPKRPAGTESHRRGNCDDGWMREVFPPEPDVVRPPEYTQVGGVPQQQFLVHDGGSSKVGITTSPAWRGRRVHALDGTCCSACRYRMKLQQLPTSCKRDTFITTSGVCSGWCCVAPWRTKQPSSCSMPLNTASDCGDTV